MQRKRLVSELFSGFTKGSEEMHHLISRNHQELHKIPANVQMGIAYGAKYAIYKKKASPEEPNQLLPLCCNLNDLNHLGSAFPLFFDFAKFSCLLIAILSLVSCLFGVISNLLVGSCRVAECANDFIYLQSLINKNSSTALNQAQVGLNFACNICLIIAIFIYRRNQNSILRKIYKENLGPSTFTLRLRGIPKLATDSEIATFIRRLSPSKEEIKIAEIVRSYDIHTVVSYYRKLNNLQAKYTRYFQLQELHNSAKKYQKKLDLLLHKAGLLQISLQRLVRSKMVPTNTVFVSFERIQDLISVYDSAKLNTVQKICKLLCFTPKCLFNPSILWNGKILINFAFAPEPTDVLWENLGTSKFQYDRRSFIANLVVFLSILISFALLVGTKILQLRISDGAVNDPRITTAFSIGRSVIVVLVNGFLKIIVQSMQSFELKHTYSSFFFGIAAKLSISIFINSALTSFLANIAGAWIQDQLRYDNLDIFFSSKGALSDIFFIALSMALSMPIIAIFSTSWMLQRLQQFLVKRRFIKHKSQAQVNTLFQGLDFDFQFHYGNIIRLCWFCGFYAPVLPSVSFLGLIGLMTYYWGLKYHILRQCAVPYYRLGTKLHEKMLGFIQFTHLGFSSGNLIWVYITQFGEKTPIALQVISIAAVVISIVDICFPRIPLREHVAQEIIKNKDSLLYSQAKEQFYATYDIENPATRQQALEKEFNLNAEIKKRNGIIFEHKLFEDAFKEPARQLVRAAAARPSLLVPDDDLIDNIKMYSLTHLNQKDLKNFTKLRRASGRCRSLAVTLYNRHATFVASKFNLSSKEAVDEPFVKDEDLIKQPTGKFFAERCMQRFPQLLDLSIDEIENAEYPQEEDSWILPSLKSNIGEFDDSNEYNQWRIQSQRVALELSMKSPTISVSMQREP